MAQYDLDSSDGVQDTKILGGTDATPIGNIGDRLKVTSDQESFPFVSRTDVNAAVITTSGFSSTFETDGLGCFSFLVDVSAFSTGGAPARDLVIELETAIDTSDFRPYFTFPRFTGNATKRVLGISAPWSKYRFKYTFSGEAPYSATVSIKTTIKAFLPSRNNNLIRYAGLDVGTNGAVSETFVSGDAPNVSLIVSRSGGVGNANVVVDVSQNEIDWVAATGNNGLGVDSSIILNFPATAFRFYRLRSASALATPGTINLFWGVSG